MSYTRPPTYLAELDHLPPFKCWLLARRAGRQPITQDDIAAATGWATRRVEKVCGLTTWKGMLIEEVDLFRSACGIDRRNERRHRAYLKRTLDLHQTVGGLAHLRKRPPPAQRRIAQLAAQLAKEKVSSSASLASVAAA